MDCTIAEMLPYKKNPTRLTVGNASHNMTIFNNLVIGLALQHGFIAARQMGGGKIKS